MLPKASINNDRTRLMMERVHCHELPNPSKFAALASMFLIGTFGVVLLTPTPPAAADEFGTCSANAAGAGCLQDSATMLTCEVAALSGFPAVLASINWAQNAMTNNTDVNVTASTCASSEVRWLEGGGLTDFVLGEWRCFDTTIVARVCDDADIAFNRSAHDFYGDDPDNQIQASDGVIESGELDLNYDMTACHEQGHAVGLRHWQLAAAGLNFFDDFGNDCTRSPWLEWEKRDDDWRRYNLHHRTHINDSV